MSAVLGLDRLPLEEACEKASNKGVVSIANYNCPGQLIISGEKEAVALASEYALSAGARRIIPLNVSGAFHTSLMKPAGDQLHNRFLDEVFAPMSIPVIFNRTALPLQEGESIPSLLEEQVQNSIYFEDSIRYMISQGVDTFVEIGPGKVLSGFIRKIDKSLTTYQVDDCNSLLLTLNALKSLNS